MFTHAHVSMITRVVSIIILLLLLLLLLSAFIKRTFADATNALKLHEFIKNKCLNKIYGYVLYN